MINQAIQEAEKMIEELEKQLKSFETEDAYKIFEQRGMCKYAVGRFKELIERLKALPQDDGWISVEDRLPEEGVKVLSTNENSGTFEVVERYGGSYDYCGGEYSMNITYWKPLPIPHRTER